MYSLYKAWLMREYETTPEESQVILTVGTGRQSRQFTGHRHLLAEHSGYIKSLLNTCRADHIAVPNVSPEVFAPLLTFMYTGYLELNAENIYGVLLASHLLHMPRAVDLCRGFLLREECPRFVHPPSVVKPIPSRKYLPSGPLYWLPPPAPLPPPPPPPPQTQPQAQPPHQPYYPGRASTSGVAPPRETSPAPAPAHTPTPAPAPAPAAAAPHSPASDSSGDGAVTVTLTEEPVPAKSGVKRSEVVTDVACCDGPVRFRRVLNANYGTPPEDTDAERERVKNSDGEEEKRPVFVCHYCKHTFKSHYCYRKHARRHINPVGLSTPEENSSGLDLNVQYYPCKTCGSKFPSYYFVHKHRKMCHPDETGQPQSTAKVSPPLEEPTTGH